jgi:hypothetical protein
MLSPHTAPALCDEPAAVGPSNAGAGGASSILRLAVLCVAALFVTGLLLALWLAPLGRNHREEARLGVFFYLFFANEPAALIAGLLFLVGGYWWFSHRSAARPPFMPGKRWLPGLALAVFGLTALGTITVYHRYPLAMDEYLAGWQGRAFRAGQVAASFPDEFRPLARALTPIFVFANEYTHTWTSGYLPVYAFLHTLFSVAGAGLLLNPLCAALSVLLIAKVARRLWPRDDFAPLGAALLLATSAQFLAAGMSFYSMPAHLCLNLLWLWLYLREDWTGTLLLPWIGVAALGLHQPFMHALFAAPFLVRMVRRRPLRMSAYTAAVYLAGCTLWLLWWKVFRPTMISYDNSQAFAFPSLYIGIAQWLGLIELLSWQNLAVGVLAVVAVFHFRRLDAPARDLSWGLALTYGFYFLVNFDQGHGWGYRYGHAVLGNLILLAVAGGRVLIAAGGERSVRRLVAAAALVALAVQLPLRAWQVERFVRPFAAANAFIRQIPEEVVVVDPTHVWYAEDLVRNDPFLADRPLILNARKLKDEDLATLRRRYSVRILGTAELIKLGLCQRAAP